MKNKLSQQVVKTWLDNYGKAWRTGDAKILQSLFSKNASYHETPFQKPLRGIKEIKEYWKAESKVWIDVKFRAGKFWISGDIFFAEWDCELKRVSTKTKVRMAGVFVCETDKNMVKNLREFWHIA